MGSTFVLLTIPSHRTSAGDARKRTFHLLESHTWDDGTFDHTSDFAERHHRKGGKGRGFPTPTPYWLLYMFILQVYPPICIKSLKRDDAAQINNYKYQIRDDSGLW
mmetsp:Transcript_18071/g.44940  ORF Transcript_18071/g.44940 Transcript_18071/m.44940 type:complete len:106 (-) Transcript_18071:1015-1332(-)